MGTPRFSTLVLFYKVTSGYTTHFHHSTLIVFTSLRHMSFSVDHCMWSDKNHFTLRYPSYTAPNGASSAHATRACFQACSSNVLCLLEYSRLLMKSNVALGGRFGHYVRLWSIRIKKQGTVRNPKITRCNGVYGV